jgi:predicted PurR-regulated permease PerM
MTEPEPVYAPQWERPVRQFVAIFLVIASVFALTLLAPVVQMLVLAFLIAFLLLGPARAISRRTPIPYSVSVTLIYVLLVVIVLLAFLIVIPELVRGINDLIAAVSRALDTLEMQLREYTPDQGVVTILGIQIDMDGLVTPLRDLVVGMGDGETDRPAMDVLQSINLREVLNSFFNVAGTLTSTVTATIGSATGVVSNLLLALFVSFLVLIDLPNTQASVVRSIPEDYRREYALLFEKLEKVWKCFFRGQVTIGLIIGLLTWIQLKLMGAPGAEVLAIFTGLISLIPTLGGLIALVPLGIIPLLQGSSVFTLMPNPIFALLVVGINLVISQVIWNVVAPVILGDVLDLPLPVIIVGVFIGAAVGGILGAFLVAPIMSSLRVIIAYLFNKIMAVDPFPEQEPAVPLGENAWE